MLEPRPDADPQARERITNGLNAAKRVSGAHTARLVEVGWFDDAPYVVREHVEGRSLRETVSADGPLTGDALERLAVGTLNALTAVHMSGIVHGGLTPDTVLLGPDGPRVCDVGLGAAGSEPDYVAPERLRAGLLPDGAPGAPGASPAPGAPGASTAAKPADLFAWAATVAYAATGRPPYGGRPELVLEGPADLSGIPAALRPLIAACLDKRPEARPDAGAAMLRLLGERPEDRVLSAVPVPQEGRPVLPGDDLRGEVVPGAAGQPGPGAPTAPAPQVWGAPPLPGDPPPANVTVLAAPVRERPRTGGLSLLLAACVGVVALLSGLGVWAAGKYTSLDDAGRTAADGAAPRIPLELAGRGEDQVADGDQGQGTGMGQGTGDDPVNRVTVPWGTTPEPREGDVGPLQLPTDVPAVPTVAPVPTLSSLTPPPVPVPSTAAPQQTDRPGTQQTPTAAPAPTATATQQPATPQPTVTLTVTPQPAPESPQPTGSPAPSPSTTPGVTPTAAPTPSVAPTAVPSASVTPTAVPSAPTTPGATPSTPAVTFTAKPTPTPTQARPTATAAKPTPAPTQSKPVPAPTQARPTATAAKPTPAPTQSKPVPAPTQSRPTPTVINSAPTVRLTSGADPSQISATPASPPPVRSFSPQQVCGAGYVPQRSLSFNGGTVHQLYNASTGNNCVVTVKTSDVGKASQLWATLEVQGGGSLTDRGSFEYYAGPVVLPAKGKCVRFSGGGPGGQASSDWGNCR
ncbi:serine/threonine protein kinase [Planomonospora sp. ID91781]|nr:serine/threonine protein kinase [Planomonospora sp. ID91781]MBG0825383.1 serine/threonine protein kinase [Planomonospora sp. ID91781]